MWTPTTARAKTIKICFHKLIIRIVCFNFPSQMASDPPSMNNNYNSNVVWSLMMIANQWLWVCHLQCYYIHRLYSDFSPVSAWVCSCSTMGGSPFSHWDNQMNFSGLSLCSTVSSQSSSSCVTHTMTNNNIMLYGREIWWGMWWFGSESACATAKLESANIKLFQFRISLLNRVKNYSTLQVSLY